MGLDGESLHFFSVPRPGGLLAEKALLQHGARRSFLSYPIRNKWDRAVFIRLQLGLPWVFWEVLGLGVRLRTG